MTEPRFGLPKPRPESPDRVAWLAGLIMVIAVLIPAAYFLGGHGHHPPTGPTLADGVELMPMPREETEFTAQETQLLQLINGARAQDARKPGDLRASPLLSRLAHDHAVHMARRGKVEDEFEGKDTAARVREAGYDARDGLVTVNYASGPALTAEDIFRSWMDSGLTRDQVLDGNLRETGIGMARGDGGEIFCCQILATPRK